MHYVYVPSSHATYLSNSHIVKICHTSKSIWSILLIFFLGYEEIDESQMDPPQRKRSNKGPSLPYRWKLAQQVKRNRRPIATVTTPNCNDGAASDTDSGYEYVANPMKKRHRSAVGKSTNDQRNQQNGNHGNREDCKSQPKQSNNAVQTKASTYLADSGKNSKFNFTLFDKPIHTSQTSKKQQTVTETFPIRNDQQPTSRSTYRRLHEDIISSGDKVKTEDADGLKGGTNTRGCNRDLCKYRSCSKGWHLASDDNIPYKKSQQEIRCSQREAKNNDGYEKLIRETMEPASRTQQYQKLNKLTMEPRLIITKPQCSRVHHHTI